MTMGHGGHGGALGCSAGRRAGRRDDVTRYGGRRFFEPRRSTTMYPNFKVRHCRVPEYSMFVITLYNLGGS